MRDLNSRRSGRVPGSGNICDSANDSLCHSSHVGPSRLDGVFDLDVYTPSSTTFPHYLGLHFRDVAHRREEQLMDAELCNPLLPETKSAHGRTGPNSGCAKVFLFSANVAELLQVQVGDDVSAQQSRTEDATVEHAPQPDLRIYRFSLESQRPVR
nr:hypothetical protein CFP56_01299 [Quercus suber]